MVFEFIFGVCALCCKMSRCIASKFAADEIATAAVALTVIAREGDERWA
jgi:hypothetical protein